MPQLEDQSALARRLRDSEVLDLQSPATAPPQLSVVMPAHNIGPWIRETLESLQAQTFTDFELIVVDDHSQDETSAVLGQFAATDPRIRIVRPHGRGGAHARNVGVLAARGRYLAFCDGDDIVPEGAYAALMAATTDADPDIVFGDFLKFSPRRTWRPTEAWQVFDTPRTGLTLADEPGLIRHRACWNKAFRTDFWRQHDIVFPEVARSNDIVPMTQAYAAASSISIIADLVYIYRARPGATSMSSKASGTRSLISYIGQELICDEILRSDRTTGARARHGWMLANSDGWVHLTTYLESLELTAQGLAEPADPEVVALIQQLVSLIGDEQRPHASQAQRRIVLAFCETGDLATAALAAQLLNRLPLESPDWFEDWARVLRQIPADSRFTHAEEVTSRWILRRLRKALQKSDEPVPASALRDLLNVLPAGAITTNGSLSMIDLRLNRCLSALMTEGTEAFERRLAPIRRTRAVISAVQQAGRSAEILGSYEASEPITLTAVAIAGKNRTLHEIGTAQASPDRPGGWTARVAADRLDPGKKRSLVLIGRTSDGDEVLIVPGSDTALMASPASAGGIELTAGTTTGAAVKIQALEPAPTSRWRGALARRLPTRRR